MTEKTEEIRRDYENICAGREVRQNLIELRSATKEEADRRLLAALLDGDFSVLTGLLRSEDPKVRKNAALLLGTMETEDLLPILYDAYLREETLYVRADYLKAISRLDYRPLAEELSARLAQLCSVQDWTAEEWKHISEEIRILQEMVLHCRGVRQHRLFVGREKETVILLTNRRFRKATAEQIRRGKITMLAGGLRVEDASLKEVLPIRTFSELLFPLDTEELPSEEPEKCGVRLADPVLCLTDRIYNGAGAFLFRLELRCGREQANAPFSEDHKGAYIRKLTDAIERASQMRLINSVSSYEFEIRLVLRADGSYVAMMKPAPSFDARFSYHRESVAASIAPANAALAGYLCRSWMKEGAQVLDPFCGVGTMLIERDRVVKAGDMYGVDLYGEAIEKARRNTQRAGCRIHYVHRDFFSFRHAYPFDEIFTDMPVKTGDGTKRELRQLYHRFFETAPALLKDEAILILYTSDPNYVVESVRAGKDYRIERSFLFNEKKGTTVYVITYQRNRS